MSRGASLFFFVIAGAACDLPLERDLGSGPVVLSSAPADGAVDVDRAGPFRVSFDRAVFPRDAHRGNVRVQSGARAALVSVWLEPVDRILEVELLGEPLAPTVRHRLVVEGLRDLALVPMAEAHEAVFETGPRAEGAAPRRESFDRVRPILARCAADGCHGGAAPALGLDLASGEGIQRTAIGVVAEGSRTGTQGDDPWHGASTLAGLARIDVVGGVGRPGQSYLMYVLLEEGAGHAADLVDPPSEEDLRTLSYWIRAGAPTE